MTALTRSKLISDVYDIPRVEIWRAVRRGEINRRGNLIVVDEQLQRFVRRWVLYGGDTSGHKKRDEARARVRSALYKFCREAYEMGHTCREIADMLNIKDQRTVATYIRQAGGTIRNPSQARRLRDDKKKHESDNMQRRNHGHL